jgi:hypothetical protein
MRVFRRHDIGAVRLVAHPGTAPVVLSIAHVDLYFFFDIDVTLLNVEVYADDLSLDVAQDILHRFGRAYPPAGNRMARAFIRCIRSSGSPRRQRAREIRFWRPRQIPDLRRHRYRASRAHWAYVNCSAQDQTGSPGTIRLSTDRVLPHAGDGVSRHGHTRALTRNDFVRLGLVTGAGEDALPYWRIT